MVLDAENVKHIDSMFGKPEYQDEDGDWLIVDYQQFNFWNYIGDTFAYRLKIHNNGLSDR